MCFSCVKEKTNKSRVKTELTEAAAQRGRMMSAATAWVPTLLSFKWHIWNTIKINGIHTQYYNYKPTQVWE